jgi:transposase
MATRQALIPLDSLSLKSWRLGALPVINHFIARLGLESLLERFVPTPDRRTRISHARSLGVLLRSILVERVALYRQQEQVSLYDAEAFGLGGDDPSILSDDRVGRALDRLFDADRQALLTQVTLALGRRFDVSFERFHNDSTTVRFCGQYEDANGRSIRGKKAPYITYGVSKDHRPDLKQLLLVLTTSDDGHVPVGFRVMDGNVNDTRTHIETWEGLRRIAGRADFLYVADSKLCAFEPLDHIDRQGGRLITVLPRSRGEDGDFRRWIQGNDPDWETVIDRENPRGKDKPRDVWRVWRSKLPSREGWPIIWVFSSIKALRHAETRRKRIQRAQQQLEALSKRLSSPKTRLRKRSKVHQAIKEILVKLEVTRYLHISVHTEEIHQHRQLKRGRPGPKTTYRRIVKKRHRIEWSVREEVINQERKHDGMYPLLTNDQSLSPADVLHQHKRQPRLEKRFTHLKDVWGIAPALLKNEGRVEALCFMHALAMIVQALIERELRRAMERQKIESLPLYPEERMSRQPTTMLVLRLFAPLERHEILSDDTPVKAVPPRLTDLQKQVLRLLGVPARVYRGK